MAIKGSRQALAKVRDGRRTYVIAIGTNYQDR
jgi:hypothetical protein